MKIKKSKTGKRFIVLHKKPDGRVLYLLETKSGFTLTEGFNGISFNKYIFKIDKEKTTVYFIRNGQIKDVSYNIDSVIGELYCLIRSNKGISSMNKLQVGSFYVRQRHRVYHFIYKKAKERGFKVKKFKGTKRTMNGEHKLYHLLRQLVFPIKFKLHPDDIDKVPTNRSYMLHNMQKDKVKSMKVFRVNNQKTFIKDLYMKKYKYAEPFIKNDVSKIIRFKVVRKYMPTNKELEYLKQFDIENCKRALIGLRNGKSWTNI